MAFGLELELELEEAMVMVSSFQTAWSDGLCVLGMLPTGSKFTNPICWLGKNHPAVSICCKSPAKLQKRKRKNMKKLCSNRADELSVETELVSTCKDRTFYISRLLWWVIKTSMPLAPDCPSMYRVALLIVSEEASQKQTLSVAIEEGILLLRLENWRGAINWYNRWVSIGFGWLFDQSPARWPLALGPCSRPSPHQTTWALWWRSSLWKPCPRWTAHAFSHCCCCG